MRARTLAAVVAWVLALGVSSRAAYADVKADVGNKIKAAMKAYDAFEYDSAKKLLTQAIAIAKKAKLDKDPILAKAYLDLGVVAFAVPDLETARTSFRAAVQIDPNIQVELAYKSPELTKLFDRTVVEVLADAEPRGGGSGGSGGSAASTGCATVRGLDHSIVRTANLGSSIPIEVRVGADVAVSKVSVMYRSEGETRFTEAVLEKRRDCNYTGVIPGSALKGSVVYYYVAGFGAGWVPVVSKGTADSPNAIALTRVAPPNAAVAAEVAPRDADLTPRVAVGKPSSPRVRFGFAGGSGLGYLRGTTEEQNTVTRCCVGSNLVVATAEVAYVVKPQLSIGGALRFGAPIGANTEGHSRGAFAGLGRLRYAFSSTGYGPHLMAQAGFGILRHTVKLTEPMFDADTDIVAQGPLLVGGGAGTSVKLTNTLALFAELSFLVGIAVVDHVGSSPMNSGVASDLMVGVAVLL